MTKKHWRVAAGVATALVAYFVIAGFALGWHRLHTDWWPLDQSIDGPNLLVSFIWLPVAFLGGWVVSEIRADKHLHRIEQRFSDHEQHVDETLAEHHLHMAQLLGVADALNSTPGDRALDDVTP